MRKRLQWRGFSVEDVNDWSLKSWDMISMLNLLDRAGNPDFFLEQASGALEEGIKIIERNIHKMEEFLFNSEFNCFNLTPE